MDSYLFTQKRFIFCISLRLCDQEEKKLNKNVKFVTYNQEMNKFSKTQKVLEEKPVK